LDEVKLMRFSRLARLSASLLISAQFFTLLSVAEDKPVDAVAVKATVQARGLGRGLKIVELDKTQVAGVLVSIGEQSFAIQQKKGEPPAEIAYAQVRSIHNKGKLSTGAKVGIWVAVGAAVAVVVAVLVFRHKFAAGFSKPI
jgi:hypothetical protein